MSMGGRILYLGDDLAKVGSQLLVPERLRQFLKPETTVDDRPDDMRGQKLDEVSLDLPT
jgi:hypothetical protein